MRTLEQAINAGTPVEGERFDGDDLQEFHISEVEFRACRFVSAISTMRASAPQSSSNAASITAPSRKPRSRTASSPRATR